jgi:hypothetical protein
MSSLSNEELVKKAVIVTDAIASAGKLSPAQSDRFIDYVVDESSLKNSARIVRFRNEQLEIDKIGVGRRLALPAAEASDPNIRRGVSTSKITLQPKEIILPFEISDNFREINIEGDNIEDTIIRMMTKQLANDLEDLEINGDTLGPAILQSDYVEGGDATRYIKDNYLALTNGYTRLADSANIYDAQGSNIGLAIFGAALRSMPTKFRRDTSQLRWYMSPDLSSIWQEKLASRATALGDAAVTGKEGVGPFGIPIVTVPLMQFKQKIVQHVTLTGTTVAALRYKPISDVVVTPSTLANTPTTPFVETTDYTIDYTNGTIVRVGSGIGSGSTVKITYLASPQVLLTHKNNFIIGIGRDIRIEKDRDIYKRVNQYAITVKLDVQFEELTAIVKAKNIGYGI